MGIKDLLSSGRSILASLLCAAVLLCGDAVTAGTYGRSGSSTSVSAVGWDSMAYAEIQALLGLATPADYQWTDFQNPAEYETTNCGGTAGSWAQLAGSDVGVLENALSTGGYLNPAGQKCEGAVVNPVSNQKTKSWGIATRWRLPSAPTSGAHFYDFIDVRDTATGNSTILAIYAGASGSVIGSTTNVQMIQDSAPGGGATTATAGSAACTIGSGITINVFYTTVMVWNAGLSTLTSAIYDGTNWSICATSTTATNQPTGPGALNMNVNVAHGMDADSMLWTGGARDL